MSYDPFYWYERDLDQSYYQEFIEKEKKMNDFEKLYFVIDYDLKKYLTVHPEQFEDAKQIIEVTKYDLLYSDYYEL